jgi:Flp pilus assembly pilin Flp
MYLPTQEPINRQTSSGLSSLKISHKTGRTALWRQRGQAMTEYIIIVALVAVAAIAVYQLFGQVVRSQTAAMAKELSGEDGTAQSQMAQSAAQSAEAQTASKSLKSFTGNADAAGG